MDDLIAEFIAECREMLEALGGEIVAWEAAARTTARGSMRFSASSTPSRAIAASSICRGSRRSATPPRTRSPRCARAAASRPALVSAVLAVIDRIGEMVAALDAGEELPGRR